MTGARPSSAQRVGELLTAAVPALFERMLEEAIRKEWRQILPPALSRRSEPGELKRGTLEVRVDNSPWLQELTMRSIEVLAALGRRHGAAVTSLRFTLGPVREEEAAPGPPAARGDGEVAPRLSPEETREIEAMVAVLPDPELAQALRRLLTKDRLARRRDALLPRAERDDP